MIAGNYAYEVSCQLCGVKHSIFLNRQDLESWLAGEGYIQDVLHYITAAERELLISGTCDKCWNKLYPNDGEFEDD